MSRRWVSFVILGMLGSLFAAIPSAGAVPPEALPVAAIRLEAATFIPAAGERPELPPGLTIAGHANSQAGYYIVQADGPVTAGWKAAVAAEGAELLDYIPDFAFKVRMNPAQAARVEQLAGVTWVGLFQPAYKLAAGIDATGPGLYRVRIERGADAGAAADDIAAAGATVVGRDGAFVVVGVPAGRLGAVARVLDVAWVERYVPAETHNEYGAGVVIGANTANGNGYDGATQIVAVSDTGIGGGTAATAHPDIPASRVVSIHNWPGSTNQCFQSIVDDGAQDVDSGHGTHTAGSVLSDGGVGGEGKGAAPAASLVFQATENFANISSFCQLFGGWPANGYFLTGLPDDLGTMYQQAYDDGARVHSNSWGAALAGDYTLDSANTDDFIWANPDMTITFSAGNEGADANGNGVVDDDSIGSPATAKNVITVGASEGDRQGNYQCDTNLTYSSSDAYQSGQTCGSMGGNQSGFLGTATRWGFNSPPLSTDPTAGNSGQMAAFSSRGPTDDGRIKPDVVAPGTWILSGYSPLYQEGYGDPANPQTGGFQWDGWGMPVSEQYKYMGGTSMSNPIAAGGAAVVRDYYQKAHGHNASAALVKATLINSAVDMADENNDGADDNDFPIPNVHEGWGRIDLAAATAGAAFDDASSVVTNGSAVSNVAVTAAGTPFKVTVVWSDFPSTEAAAANLVNDLDLVVTAPGGTQYKGNVFSGGWSQAGGAADRANNVENVYVESAAAGTWTVEVVGFNVPNGPQPFALVVDGDLGVVNQPPTVTIESPADGATVSTAVPISIAASDEDAAGTLSVEWNVDGGGWQSATFNSGTGRYEASWDSTSVGDGGHTINARATDSGNAIGSDAVGIVVDNVVAPAMHVGDLDGSRTSAKGGKWNPSVAITVHDAGEAAVAGATVFGDWGGGTSGSASCVTNGSGLCSVTQSNVSRNVTSVTFTVTDVTHPSLEYAAEANHDLDGNSDGTTITVAKDSGDPPPPPGDAVHVGDLDGSSAPNGSRWTAAVTITVHDAAELPVDGATVTGSWSDGAKGSGSCTTDGSGICQVEKGVKANSPSVTFTVTAVTTPAGAALDAVASHDPDGDSDGTRIVVVAP